MAFQSTLNFHATGADKGTAECDRDDTQRSVIPYTCIPGGFYEVFRQYITLHHGYGIRDIQQGDGLRKGYDVFYKNTSTPEHYSGLCYRINEVFANPHANTVIAKRMKSRLNTSSRQKGDLIHRHIYHQVECIQHAQVVRSQHDTRNPRMQTTAESACKCPVRSPSVINPLAKSLLDTLQTYRWIPFRSELHVVCKHMNLVTSVDLLCLNPVISADTDAQLATRYNNVIVSWKTGYKDIETQQKIPTGTSSSATENFMREPLIHIPDNERERNQLQLLCEYLILTRCYKLDIHKCIIVYISCDKHNPDKRILDSAAAWWWKDTDTQDKVWDAMHQESPRASTTDVVPVSDRADIQSIPVYQT
jgi:hypothetical protein